MAASLSRSVKRLFMMLKPAKRSPDVANICCVGADAIMVMRVISRTLGEVTVLDRQKAREPGSLLFDMGEGSKIAIGRRP